MIDKIEILSTDLLETHAELIEELEEIAHFIVLKSGWHYHLDWAWILSNLGDIQSTKILDAGAGKGVLQWYLASKGAEVISVDRNSRACLPLHIRKNYDVTGLRPFDLLSISQILNPLKPNIPVLDRLKCIVRSIQGFLRKKNKLQKAGSVKIYNQDLRQLSDIEDNSIDKVISVSALEHNDPEDLMLVVKELERILKPGGLMVVTLNASREKDWFHEPSKGWCYSEFSLKKLFDLSPSATSNYHLYDDLFTKVKENEHLQSNLSRVFFHSNKGGMPMGIWDPKYLPVGVIKIKAV